MIRSASMKLYDCSETLSTNLIIIKNKVLLVLLISKFANIFKVKSASFDILIDTDYWLAL